MIGAGGLGHIAVQVLDAVTATRVIVVDPRPAALQLADDRGAQLTLAPGEDVVDQIREATQGYGADVVLDFVGSNTTLATRAACVRQLCDLAAHGRLRADLTLFPLAAAATRCAGLATGEITGRAVARPFGHYTPER